MKGRKMMKNILEEFYEGNIHPCDETPPEGSTYYNTLYKLSEMEEKLLSRLEEDEEGKRMMQEHEDLIYQYLKTASAERFILGFKLGAQFTLAAMEDL